MPKKNHFGLINLKNLLCNRKVPWMFLHGTIDAKRTFIFENVEFDPCTKMFH